MQRALDSKVENKEELMEEFLKLQNQQEEKLHSLQKMKREYQQV